MSGRRFAIVCAALVAVPAVIIASGIGGALAVGLCLALDGGVLAVARMVG